MSVDGTPASHLRVLVRDTNQTRAHIQMIYSHVIISLIQSRENFFSAHFEYFWHFRCYRERSANKIIPLLTMPSTKLFCSSKVSSVRAFSYAVSRYIMFVSRTIRQTHLRSSSKSRAIFVEMFQS